MDKAELPNTLLVSFHSCILIYANTIGGLVSASMSAPLH
jgi:hypothetical protein